MPKTYNTPKRSHIVKTRLDDEEYSGFLRHLELYGMNQSEFLRQAITGAPDKSSGKRRQNIHIKYDGIGFIPLNELMQKKTA